MLGVGGLGRAFGHVDGGRAVPVRASAISHLLAAGGDVNILVIGDSTSDTTSEWVYVFFASLGVASHSVVYHAWDDGAGDYAAGETLSVGSGADQIHVWNASVGGARGIYYIGAKYQNAVLDTTPDLVIFNVGINSNSAGNATLIRGELMTPLAQIHEDFPDANLMAIIQNPNRDSTVMTAVSTAWRDVETLLPGLVVVDVHAAFIALGKSGTLYSDAIHPNAAGTAVYVSTFRDAWFGRSSLETMTPWLDAVGTDQLLNGGFTDFAGAAPTSWTRTANLTSTKELSIVDPLNNPGWSVQLDDVGGTTFSRLYQAMGTTPRDAIRGQFVTIIARVYIPANMPQGAGRLAFAFNSVSAGNTTLTTRTETFGRDGWHYIIIPGIAVPSDATVPTVSLYYDSAIPSVANSVFWSRARMVIGQVPRG